MALEEKKIAKKRNEKADNNGTVNADTISPRMK